MPTGHIFYMDLDIVILKNFDEEINKMLNRKEKMCCVSDAIGWLGGKFSSSLMCFESGANSQIFKQFVNDESTINNRPGGDQLWTGPQLESVYYVDEDFPNLKKNLKYDIGERDGSNLTLPLQLPDGVKLVDCGGRPKPHELEMIPYIRDNWNLIEL